MALLACGALASAQGFVKAQVIFFRPASGETAYDPPKQITITDKNELAKISKLLPGLGLSKGGLKPSGWAGWGTMRLIRAKGPGLQVFFRSDGKVYSMVGKQGDFPAGKGFLEFLTDLEKRAKQ
jgi:hypothetical protein